MFKAFVTISGENTEGYYNYLDISLEREFERFGDARRWYERLCVKPWGTLAMTIHANHPELTQIEAEYDIYEDGEPVDGCDWFINEAIWWKED